MIGISKELVCDEPVSILCITNRDKYVLFWHFLDHEMPVMLREKSNDPGLIHAACPISSTNRLITQSVRAGGRYFKLRTLKNH